jgi:hypothetical protein
MAFINRESKEPATLSFLYRQAMETLAETLLDSERHCVFFLGAGASIDEKAPQDLPTALELSEAMAKECSLEWHKAIPLSTIAFYYEFLRGRPKLTKMLEKKIGDRNVDPSRTIFRLIDIVDLLERMQLRTVVITTNYDQHFERAYAQIFKRDPEVLIYQGARNPNERNVKLNRDKNGELKISPTVWTPRKPTTLFKMHGCISQADDQGLVITEEDYINFLTNAMGLHDDYKKLPTAIMGRVAEGTIVFVGYSLEDWNFRTIFKATVEAHATPGKSYAIQFWDLSKGETDTQLTRREALTRFWDRKGVDILNVQADQFMDDLLTAMQNEQAKASVS